LSGVSSLNGKDVKRSGGIGQGLSNTQVVLIVSGVLLGVSLFLYPQPPHFIGAAATIAILYFAALKFFASKKLVLLLRASPYAGLALSFAYLRSYPFNPQVPAFWSMTLSYVATQVFVLALFALTYRRKGR
jgi:hypothetical protein